MSISKTYLSAAIAKAVFSPEHAGEVELKDFAKEAKVWL
jgi:hypothetical protein